MPNGRALAGWYLGTCCVAAVAGVVSGGVGVWVFTGTTLGCDRVTGGDASPEGDLVCPDGTGLVIPGLVSIGVGALAVLAVSAMLLRRRADRVTQVTVARHLMWLAVAVVAVPALPWAVLSGSSGVATGVLWGCAAVGLAIVPLVVSVRWPARVTTTVAVCLVAPVVVLALAPWLPLLVPVGLALAVLWSIVLSLLRVA